MFKELYNKLVPIKKIVLTNFLGNFFTIKTTNKKNTINLHPPHCWLITWDKNIPMLQPSLPCTCYLEERLMLLSYVCQEKERKMQPCWTRCCEKQQDTRSEWAGTTVTNKSEYKVIQLMVLSCILLKSPMFWQRQYLPSSVWIRQKQYVAGYSSLAISTGNGRKHCAINKKLSQPDIDISLGLVVKVVV
jgi:hypothetical protein